MKKELTDLVSKMFDYIVDFTAKRIDYTTAQREIEKLESQYKAIKGRYYHVQMGYQTLASFIHQNWN